MRRPYLDLWLDVGVVSVGSRLMFVSTHGMTVEYVALQVKVWWDRWGFAIRLYDTMRRRHDCKECGR